MFFPYFGNCKYTNNILIYTSLLVFSNDVHTYFSRTLSSHISYSMYCSQVERRVTYICYLASRDAERVGRCIVTCLDMHNVILNGVVAFSTQAPRKYSPRGMT